VINPVFLVILSWLLVGPPLLITVAILFIVLGLVSVITRNFRRKALALMGIMGVLFVQCILFVFVLYFVHPDANAPGVWLFQMLFGVDLHLAELGAIAAILGALYIELVRSRLDLFRAFPNLTFSKPANDLIQMTHRLAASARIKCPGIVLLDSGLPSAFTVRTRRAYTIAVSVGLLESFEPAEVEACLAHEICHIKNRDFALRSIVTVAKIALFARVLSYLVEAAFYRARELTADRAAAALIGGPGPLISALAKLQEANSSGNIAGTFACCLDGERRTLEILSKHPNLKRRIGLLREMEPAESSRVQ